MSPISANQSYPSSIKENILANNPATANAEPRYCLVADDNTVNRMTMGKILERMGFLVEYAEDGLVGLKKLQSKKFHFAIFDQSMPGMSGSEAVSRWRSQESNPRLPIFSWTTENNEQKIKCTEAGMDGFIDKPVNPSSVREILKKNDLLTS